MCMRTDARIYVEIVGSQSHEKEGGDSSAERTWFICVT